MKKLKQMFMAEEGQGMVEYGLILALVAVVVIVILTTMGNQLKAIFTNVSGALAIGATPPK